MFVVECPSTRGMRTSRPINGEDARAEVLASLESVDAVTLFEEDTPLELIEAILPDFLVKGGDYQPQQIAGYDAVTANGGEVRVLPFHDGYSTTSTISKAQLISTGVTAS